MQTLKPTRTILLFLRALFLFERSWHLDFIHPTGVKAMPSWLIPMHS